MEKAMSVTLLIGSEDLHAEEVQALTRDVCSDLNNETEVQAKLPESETTGGMRGDPVTLGTLLLTFLTSGAAVGMLQVLKSYFERKPSLQIEFRRADGEKLEIRAEHLNPEQIKQTLAVTRGFLGRSR